MSKYPQERFPEQQMNDELDRRNFKDYFINGEVQQRENIFVGSEIQWQLIKH